MNPYSGSRSVVIPGLRYRDAKAAIAWLERAFGFSVQTRYDGPGDTVMHAQLILANSNGRGMIMLGSATNEGVWSSQMAHPDDMQGRSTVSISLIVPDASVLYACARAAGAEIVQELQQMPYGGRAFGCKDLEGYLWAVGEYDPWHTSGEVPGA